MANITQKNVWLYFHCSFLTIWCITSQNGQTHFKNLAAFAARFLKCVWPFCTLCIKGLKTGRVDWHNTTGTYERFKSTSLRTTLRKYCYGFLITNYGVLIWLEDDKERSFKWDNENLSFIAAIKKHRKMFSTIQISFIYWSYVFLFKSSRNRVLDPLDMTKH